MAGPNAAAARAKTAGRAAGAAPGHPCGDRWALLQLDLEDAELDLGAPPALLVGPLVVVELAAELDDATRGEGAELLGDARVEGDQADVALTGAGGPERGPCAGPLAGAVLEPAHDRLGDQLGGEGDGVLHGGVLLGWWGVGRAMDGPVGTPSCKGSTHGCARNGPGPGAKRRSAPGGTLRSGRRVRSGTIPARSAGSAFPNSSPGAPCGTARLGHRVARPRPPPPGRPAAQDPPPPARQAGTARRGGVWTGHPLAGWPAAPQCRC